MATTERLDLTSESGCAQTCLVNLRHQPPPSRVESAEGAGKARRRWFDFVRTVPRDALDASGLMDPYLLNESFLNAAQRKALASRAKENSELLGFWVTWHLAGGFDVLETWGWHRATIYRKIKRFRDEFGVHPDEFKFDWIKLDLTKAWTEKFLSGLGAETDE